MAEDKKKNRKRLIYLVFLTAAVLAGLLLIFIMSSSYTVIVEERDGQFYKAKNIFICGNAMVSRRDPGSTAKKADALKSDPESYSLNFRSISGIRNIEIIPQVDEDEVEQGTVDPKYLGRYNVIVQGHAGILFLREKDGKLYGTIRFPKWGNGAVEYLRGLRINNDRIQFTRSANSSKEIRRLGANYYFTQKFYGRYNASGRKIEGHFINDRKEEHLWEGSR